MISFNLQPLELKNSVTTCLHFYFKEEKTENQGRWVTTRAWVQECKKQELHWGLWITGLLSPFMLFQMCSLPCLLPHCFPSYSLEVKRGEECCEPEEVVRTLLLPQNPASAKEHPSSCEATACPDGYDGSVPVPCWLQQKKKICCSLREISGLTLWKVSL